MEGIPIPDSLFHDGIAEISVFVADELPLASVLSHLGPIRAHEELPLKQLDADDGKHKLEKECDEDDVADGFDGYDHTLNDMFETLGTIDGTERTQDAKNTKNFDHRNCTGAGKRKGEGIVS